MSYSTTVGDLTGSVRVLGDYPSETSGRDQYITDAFIISRVAAGYKESYEVLANADPDRLTTTATVTIGLTFGGGGGGGSITGGSTGSFALPEDLWRLRAIHVQDGGQWFRLLRDDPSPLNSPWELDDGTAGGSGGLPYRYRLEGDHAFVAPDAPAGTVFRTTYIPAPVSLSSSLQTIDGTAGTDELTVWLALRDCRVREDRDTRECDIKIGAETRRLRGMARNRDAGQAKRIEDPLRSRRRRR